MTIYDGGPAFATERRLNEHGQVDEYGEPGMSLRDYFAAAALQGLLARDDEHPATTIANWVEDAFRFADAMLDERTKDRGDDAMLKAREVSDD